MSGFPLDISSPSQPESPAIGVSAPAEAASEPLRQRVEELDTLYRLSRLLSGQRDLQQILDTAARSAVEALGAKAATIRLLDESGDELVIKAVHNLSPEYLNKGPIFLAPSAYHKQALAGEVVQVYDMTADPVVIYPEEARREGLMSMLCVGIIFGDQPFGAIQIYTGEHRRYGEEQVNLLRAIAQLLAAAIQTARLDTQRLAAERIQFQLRMAADVQKRMLPKELPQLKQFDIAARCVSSFDLGGDFYDVFKLGTSLGIAVADVAGKGIPASLLMASVRSALRAFAQDVYDIDVIMARINDALCRDMLPHEFATLFYGVLEPKSRRFTYCNAGHEPPVLLRNGEVSLLDSSGMVVGVEAGQKYSKSMVDFHPGDVFLIYTDGLSDAQNFERQRFGKERILTALRQCKDLSASDTLNHILWEMRRFVGLNVQTDDTTLVVLRCRE